MSSVTVAPETPLMRKFLKVLEPNAVVAPMTMKLIILVWVISLLGLWAIQPWHSLPSMGEVLEALGKLWNEGLAVHLWTSCKLNVHALLLSSIISLVIAYLTPVPLFRPLGSMVSAMRFLGLTGFTAMFTIMMGGGYNFRITLIVMGITYFYVTNMMQVVGNVRSECWDDAATLKMGKWHALWEVVVIGKRDEAFDALRQNAAIGWMMLAIVEGLSRSGGGVGMLLKNNEKHFDLPEIFAIQLMILIIGLGFDYCLLALKRFVAPYAHLTLVRR